MIKCFETPVNKKVTLKTKINEKVDVFYKWEDVSGVKVIRLFSLLQLVC